MLLLSCTNAQNRTVHSAGEKKKKKAFHSVFHSSFPSTPSVTAMALLWEKYFTITLVARKLLVVQHCYAAQTLSTIIGSLKIINIIMSLISILMYFKRIQTSFPTTRLTAWTLKISSEITCLFDELESEYAVASCAADIHVNMILIGAMNKDYIPGNFHIFINHNVQQRHLLGIIILLFISAQWRVSPLYQ